MIDNVWLTEKWKIKSLKNKKNKATLVDGETSKHTAGSISFELKKHRMEKEKGGEVNSFDWYQECHVKKVCREESPEYVTRRARNVALEYKWLFVETRLIIIALVI